MRYRKRLPPYPVNGWWVQKLTWIGVRVTLIALVMFVWRMVVTGTVLQYSLEGSLTAVVEGSGSSDAEVAFRKFARSVPRSKRVRGSCTSRFLIV